MEGQITRYSEDMKITDYNEECYEISETIDNTQKDEDEFVYTKKGDTLRDIADRVYGDARFYWIIGEFNNIINPWEKFTVRKRLRYPSLQRIYEDYL
jgi:nucleoid-associated protein YgaU